MDKNDINKITKGRMVWNPFKTRDQGAGKITTPEIVNPVKQGSNGEGRIELSPEQAEALRNKYAVRSAGFDGNKTMNKGAGGIVTPNVTNASMQGSGGIGRIEGISDNDPRHQRVA